MSTIDTQTGLRVTAALDFLRHSDAEDMRDHFVWTLKHIMADALPEELSTPAIVSMLAILGPEHSRILRGRKPPGDIGVVLELVRDRDSAVALGESVDEFRDKGTIGDAS